MKKLQKVWHMVSVGKVPPTRPCRSRIACWRHCSSTQYPNDASDDGRIGSTTSPFIFALIARWNVTVAVEMRV